MSLPHASGLSDWQRPRRLAWAVFIFALAIRLGNILISGERPGGDTSDYDEIALNILSGEGFVARENWHGFELRSWRPPLYPIFLATIYAVFGHDHLPVMLVQALLGAGAVLLLYLLSGRLHPPSALATGIIGSLYGPIIDGVNTVMSETVFTFLVLLSIHLCVRYVAGRAEPHEREQRSVQVRERWGWFATGVTIGLAALTRPAGLALWPVALLLPLWERNSGRAAVVQWRGWLLLSLGALMCLAPWTVRNYQVHDSFVAISTQAGFIFARSNTAEPAWRQERGWGIERRVFERLPSEIERDRHWFRAGFEFIQAHPAWYLRLAMEKFLRFWYFMRPDYDFWYMSILPFFALGLWRYGGTEHFRYLSAFGVASLTLFCFVLYGSARFRLPLEPLFIVFATAYLCDNWQRRRAYTALAVGLVVVLNAVCWWQEESLRQLIVGCLQQLDLK